MKPAKKTGPASGTGWLIPLLIILLLTGCAHYRLGRDAKPPFSSIHVVPAVNESFAPQAQALLTAGIRNELIKDGLLEVRNEPNADAVLSVVLKDFNRRVAATSTADTGIAEKLRLELKAEITLTDSRTGKVHINKRTVSTSADAFPQDHAARAEFQSMSVLTENLARRIAYEVLQVW